MNNEFSTERQDCAVKISPLAYNIIERIKIIRQSQGDTAANVDDIVSEIIRLKSAMSR